MCVRAERGWGVWLFFFFGGRGKSQINPSVLLHKKHANEMHFAALMWHQQCVGIWVVKEDESPQASDPMRRIALHAEPEGFWQSTDRVDGHSLCGQTLPLQRWCSGDRGPSSVTLHRPLTCAGQT